MPRLPRVMSPGIPQHVVQRGHNREPCFFADADYLTYLHWLERAACAYRVSVHAYVLMPNHVHLLVTPETEGGISRMMQYLGRQYVQHVNRTYRRRGTLWERRFLASLVDAEYLLQLYCYIESNPVRGAIVAAPEDYCWSSARAHLAPGGKTFVVDHAKYLDLGATPQTRAGAYLEAAREPLADAVLADIRRAIRHCVPLGSEGFAEQIERKLGRRVRLRKAGRKPRQIAP
jgi:REP-associated tyrosine transposase